jgi:heptosyltransferase-2
MPDPPPMQLAAETICNLVIIKQHNQLGDLLCVTPMIATLRKAFANATLTLVASPQNISAVADFDMVDRLLCLDKKNIWPFVQDFFSARYDVAIVPSTVANSQTSNFLALASGARIRIGLGSLMETNRTVVNDSAYCFTHRLAFDWRSADLHQTEKYLQYLSPFGLSASDAPTLAPIVSRSPQSEKVAEAFLQTAFDEPRPLMIGLHLSTSAGRLDNRWAKEKSLVLCNLILQTMAANLVLTCGPADGEVIEFLSSQLPLSRVAVLRNATVSETASMIAKLSLFISLDTGVMHIAGSTATPLLSIFNAANPAEWCPKRANSFYIRKPSLNIQDITPSEVLSKIQDMAFGLVPH